MKDLKYYHVDVFSNGPLTGNGLSVVVGKHNCIEKSLQTLAQEFKQFETIFLDVNDAHREQADARIFTVEEELGFAGHPVLGGAAVMHHLNFGPETEKKLCIQLREKMVEVNSFRIPEEPACYEETMNQGIPELLATPTFSEVEDIIHMLSLSEENLAPGWKLQVISTGLPYLLIPLRTGLMQAKIQGETLEERLQRIKAKFVYLFDVNTMKARTWDNLGCVEDVATGSAAGPLCAYMVLNHHLKAGERLQIHQGEMLMRPSVLTAYMDREWEDNGKVYVSGRVDFVMEGGFL